MVKKILSVSIMSLGLLVLSCEIGNYKALAETSQSEAKEKLNDVKNETKQKKEQLKKVEAELEQHKKDLSQVDEKLATYIEQIDKLNKNIAHNEKELNVVEQKVRKKLQRLYLQGENAYLAKLLAADSFSDFLNRFQLIRIIVKQDFNDLKHFNEIKQNLENDKKKIEIAKAEQEKLLKESKQRVDKMNKEMAKYKVELKELEKEQEKLMGQAFGFAGGGVLAYPTTPGKTYWNYGQNRGDHIHAGVDIPRPVGTPIYAAEDGVVESIRYDGDGYGWYFIIRHSNGLKTLYPHMWSYQVKVSVGQRVSRGQVVGAVGNAGRSTGPHLHFEVHKYGRAVNPKPYIS